MSFKGFMEYRKQFGGPQHYRVQTSNKKLATVLSSPAT
jgi:hypothetical protein